MRVRIKGTNTIIDVNWIDGDDYKCCRTGAIYRTDELDFDDLGPLGPLMIEKPLDPKIEFMVNWKQERVNVAKDAMLEILKKMWDDTPFRRAIADSADREGRLLPEYVARHCVEYADNLITALKNGDKN